MRSLLSLIEADDLKKTVVGLSKKGHSASSISDFLHSKERPVTKNKVIGILNRTTHEEKTKIENDIKAGNEPENILNIKINQLLNFFPFQLHLYFVVLFQMKN